MPSSSLHWSPFYFLEESSMEMSFKMFFKSEYWESYWCKRNCWFRSILRYKLPFLHNGQFKIILHSLDWQISSLLRNSGFTKHWLRYLTRNPDILKKTTICYFYDVLLFLPFLQLMVLYFRWLMSAHFSANNVQCFEKYICMNVSAV